jgi:hypothetical protein
MKTGGRRLFRGKGLERNESWRHRVSGGHRHVADLEHLSNMVASRHAGAVDLITLGRVSLHDFWSLQLNAYSALCRGTDAAAGPRRWRRRLLRTATCCKNFTIVLCSLYLPRAYEGRYEDETFKADHIRDDEPEETPGQNDKGHGLM